MLDRPYITKLARMLRLGTIRTFWKQDMLSEEDARELLAGPLSPDDPTTVVDDSALLDDPDGLRKIWEGVVDEEVMP